MSRSHQSRHVGAIRPAEPRTHTHIHTHTHQNPLRAADNEKVFSWSKTVVVFAPRVVCVLSVCLSVPSGPCRVCECGFSDRNGNTRRISVTFVRSIFFWCVSRQLQIESSQKITNKNQSIGLVCAASSNIVHNFLSSSRGIVLPYTHKHTHKRTHSLTHTYILI